MTKKPKSVLMWIKSWATMKRMSHRFTDKCSGAGVYLYVDCYGDEYLAEFSRWGFRVKLN